MSDSVRLRFVLTIEHETGFVSVEGMNARDSFRLERQQVKGWNIGDYTLRAVAKSDQRNRGEQYARGRTADGPQAMTARGWCKQGMRVVDEKKRMGRTFQTSDRTRRAGKS